MTTTLPPPLSEAPTVPELAALCDALVRWQSATAEVVLPPTPTATPVRPLGDASLLGQLLAGLVSLEEYQQVAVPTSDTGSTSAPRVAEVPRLELVPTASFSAGQVHTGFLDSLLAFLRWLLQR